MRLTESQVRGIVAGILREGAHTVYPDPDRKISDAIDAIGEKIRRDVAADPDFDIARNYVEPEPEFDEDGPGPVNRDREEIQLLFYDKYKSSIKLISRLMKRQAQLLAPVVLRDKERLMAGLVGRGLLQNIENFTGEVDEELEQYPAYVGDEVFGSLDGLETGIVLCLDMLLFPAPNEHPRRRANRLSELTDALVYGNLLGLYNYVRPSLRS